MCQGYKRRHKKQCQPSEYHEGIDMGLSWSSHTLHYREPTHHKLTMGQLGTFGFDQSVPFGFILDARCTQIALNGF